MDEQGEQLGVIPVDRAIEIANERDLDLVEVAPSADPPVCRLLNYGKFRYEANRKEREARKVRRNRGNNELREVRMKTRIGLHDREAKTRLVRRLLAEGSKVKVSVMFRGREMQHPHVGMALLKAVAADLADEAMLDRAPVFEGRFLAMILTPDPAKVRREERMEKELDRAKA